MSLPLPLGNVLPAGIGSLGPLPYPIDIRGEPAYISLGGREGGPGRSRLILVPLHLLTQIGNLLADPSIGIGPGFALSLPRLSRHPLGLVNIPYKQFGPFTDVAPLPLGRPQPLPKIPTPPQQGTNPPLYILPYALAMAIIKQVYLSVGLVSVSPYLTHYWVVVFQSQISGYFGL